MLQTQPVLTLLLTKLHVPTPHTNHILRPRLVAHVKMGLSRPLTLISAPAGWGKTALVSEWIAGLWGANGASAKVAWLSLDVDDNDPMRFFSYLIAGLQMIYPSIGDAALTTLRIAPSPSWLGVVTTLINDLATLDTSRGHTTRSHLLVLDDYHLIETPAIHEALTLFLERLPASLHVVISSRSDPPMPVARWRARQQVNEIRASDLRFTQEEAAQFLDRSMGLRLTSSEVLTLEERTEGWIAGLQLAALSMQGQTNLGSFIKGFTGSHRHIMDYLIEEVLSRQSPAVQRFLFQTCILTRMSAPLCDFMLDQQNELSLHTIGSSPQEQDSPQLDTDERSQLNSQTMLEELERTNMFVIPLDHERHWYRYHHLFADVLRVRVQHTGQSVRQLHQRASRWYEAENYLHDAVYHLLAANHFAEAAHLIEKNVEEMLRRSEHLTIAEWLDKIPGETKQGFPRLLLARAEEYVRSSQLEKAQLLIEQAEAQIETIKDTAQRQRLIALAAVWRTGLALYRSDLAQGKEAGYRALAHLPPGDHPGDLRLRAQLMVLLAPIYAWGGEIEQSDAAYAEAYQLGKRTNTVYYMFTGLANLGAIRQDRGQLSAALEQFQQALHIATQHNAGHFPMVGLLHSNMSLLYYDRNQLDEAYHHANTAHRIGERGNAPRVIASNIEGYGLTLLARGDLAGAQRLVNEIRQVVATHELSIRYSTWVDWIQVRIWLQEGNLADATAWISHKELSLDSTIDYLHLGWYLAWVHILLAQRQFTTLLSLAEKLLQFLESEKRGLHIVWLLPLVAVAYDQSKQPQQAFATLEKVLALAAPEGFVRAFVDVGAAMLSLLSRFRHQCSNAGLLIVIDRLLTAFEPSLMTGLTTQSHNLAPLLSAHTAASKRLVPGLIEPLSERELEVLRLIAQGLSDRQVAERLILALGTVKKHINNLYGKLGVNSRVQALMRARQLQILEDA